MSPNIGLAAAGKKLPEHHGLVDVRHAHLLQKEIAQMAKGGSHRFSFPGLRNGRPCAHSPFLIVVSTTYAAAPSGSIAKR